VLRGDVHLQGQALHAGDGAAMSDEQHVQITADSSAELMWFDLA